MTVILGDGPLRSVEGHLLGAVLKRGYFVPTAEAGSNSIAAEPVRFTHASTPKAVAIAIGPVRSDGGSVYEIDRLNSVHEKALALGAAYHNV